MEATARDYATLAGSQVNRAFKAEVPVQTGALRQSHTFDGLHKVNGEYVLRWRARKPYALPVHEGRGPVFAKNAKALRFVIGGRVIYRKSVGPARSNDWLVRGLRRAGYRRVSAANKNIG